METGAVNGNQNCGISTYQGRMAVEVLTCVNNLQSRCDMLEDSSGMLGCAACCSGLENTGNGVLPQNCLQVNYAHTSSIASAYALWRENHPYTDLLANAVSGQPFIANNPPYLVSGVNDRPTTSAFYEKRLRKRPAGSSEDKKAKKKRRTIHLDNSSQPAVVYENGFTPTPPDRPQVDKGKDMATKPRKVKDPSLVVKSEAENLLPKGQKTNLTKVEDEEIDAQIAAFEMERCAALLRSYGIIANPDLTKLEMVPHCVPHPGYVGDGLLTKMCKVCGTIEDANNTVICDDCQEAFHLSCCVPRLTSKYFKREDNWFCSSCRKCRRKLRPKFTEKRSSSEDNSTKVPAIKEAKARLGPAHQADVPEWQNRVQDDDDAERCIKGCIGMEVPFTEDQKVAEKDSLLKSFNAKIESLGWLPADKIPHGTVQNWVKCTNVIMREQKESEAGKQASTVCGKWRRAPLNVEQTDEWECFCAMEWDPLHADCAIPQECSDEEVLNRLSYGMQKNGETQAHEPGSRKATLRQGKCV